jgi:hypothetical protein
MAAVMAMIAVVPVMAFEARLLHEVHLRGMHAARVNRYRRCLRRERAQTERNSAGQACKDQSAFHGAFSFCWLSAAFVWQSVSLGAGFKGVALNEG